jgi:beta-lactam-binding protein with PASTA domain
MKELVSRFVRQSPTLVVAMLALLVALTGTASKRCAVGRVTRNYSRSVRKGRVIAQRPRAGVRLPRGGRVNLRVSRGRR